MHAIKDGTKKRRCKNEKSRRRMTKERKEF